MTLVGCGVQTVRARVARLGCGLGRMRRRWQGRTPSTRFHLVTAGVLVSMTMASVAHGQTTHAPTLEIAAGYQSLQRDDPPAERGWFVSAARPLGEHFSVTGEFGTVAYRDAVPEYVDEGRLYTYLAGVRYAFPVARVKPFVQVLAGAATGEVQQELLSSGVTASSFARTRHFGALQAGGGMDVRITRRIAARVAANAFTRYAGGVSLTRFRFTTGVVFGIGNP